MAIDDARAVEVVGRDLNPNPVPRQDPDAEAAHLAGDVAEHLVAVVELHPEHRVRERLHDLAFEFDFLFFSQELDDLDVRGLRALAGLAELVLDLRALRERAETVTRDTREVHERILSPVVGGDETEALLVAEPLDDTSCHTTPPHCLNRCARGAAGHCLPACFMTALSAADTDGGVYTSPGPISPAGRPHRRPGPAVPVARYRGAPAARTRTGSGRSRSRRPPAPARPWGRGRCCRCRAARSGSSCRLRRVDVAAGQRAARRGVLAVERRRH